MAANYKERVVITPFSLIVNKKLSSVPRHRDVKNNLVCKIWKDWEIPALTSFQ